MNDMLAAMMYGPWQMKMERKPIPEPAAGELLIRIKHVGICGSDLGSYQRPLELLRARGFGDDFILGHEAAGEVVAIGEGVTGFAIGDRVALEPGSTCGECEFCKKGLYNLCPNVQFLASIGQRYGVLREYAAHPANLCFKLPDNMTTVQGALIEPLSVGLHAANLANATVGMDALIFGSGCIGLCNLLSLKARGVSRVAICDLMDNRLKKAKDLGADLTVNVTKENIIDVISEWTNGRGVDVVIEASGSPLAIGQTWQVACRGGTIIQVGNTDEPMPKEFDVRHFANKELTYKGLFRYRNIYPMAIEAVSSGRLKVEQIADRIYPFADTIQAFEDSIHHKDEIVKAVVAMD